MTAHTLNLLSLSSITSSPELRRFNVFRLIPPSSDKSSGLVSSFVGRPLSLRLVNPNCIVLKRQSTVLTVAFSLPASKREDVPADKLPKWSARAIRSFAMAELQAVKLKYPEIGTEALLLGIMVEVMTVATSWFDKELATPVKWHGPFQWPGTSEVAKFLRANGITHAKVREETLNLLGKSDMYFVSPKDPPLTEPAQKAIDWAVGQKLKSGGDGEITVAYLFLGLWEQKESAAHRILEFLGFNDEKVKEISKYVGSLVDSLNDLFFFDIFLIFLLDKDIVLTHKLHAAKS
ncbi:hypothetical protein Cgig2_033197 [Carnegiea gigantea]|uniref:Clp R domain-containing protein n=1 Tax=Carnegiea gigantea TaxID=171969 RepID=A0A9Q1JQW6_9CARY|nr:hypothetical protein Cgig2_033197 [Carnegiea gigantea]